MSARPDLARLSDEELDLLLSRSLDGDLSPEEERELSAHLASDPRAARRREELAGLVARLKDLPAPAPPLGMTARVNARAADHAKGFGAIWHRLGIFPPPSMVRGIAALFVIVVIGMNVLKSQCARQKAAEVAPAAAPAPADGRVSIFFDEKKPAAPAAPAPKSVPAEKRAAESKGDAPARLRSEPVQAPPEQAASGEKGGASVAALEADAPRKDAPAAADALEARKENAGSAGGVRSEAALQKKAKAEAAPPAPALASAIAPVSWDVSVVGPPARSWALRRFAAPPPARAGISASYRLTLGAEGQVVSAKAIEGATPETDALARSLVFTPLEASPPFEIEVTVRTR